MESVGRIVPLDCHEQPPVPTCNCREIVLEYKRAMDASRSYRDEAAAFIKLLESFGIER